MNIEERYCDRCGTPAGKLPSLKSNPYSKSKPLAVLLAVCFGFFSFLYTIHTDLNKFISTMGVAFMFLIILLAGAWESMANMPPSSNFQWMEGGLVQLAFLVSFLLPTWVFPIAVAIRRKTSYYSNYM
jgi:ribose/xylose/arabinose/galactoside ABC-type transport system permease subunit